MELEKAILSQTNRFTLNKINDLKENVIFLKEGGSKNNIEINPLPEKFEDSYSLLLENYESYENSVIRLTNLQDLSITEKTMYLLN